MLSDLPMARNLPLAEARAFEGIATITRQVEDQVVTYLNVMVFRQLKCTETTTKVTDDDQATAAQ
jgi:hypothetical protein